MWSLNVSLTSMLSQPAFSIIVNFEHILHLILVFLLLTLNMYLPSGLSLGLLRCYFNNWHVVKVEIRINDIFSFFREYNFMRRLSFVRFKTHFPLGTLHKKWSFLLKISSVNVTKSAGASRPHLQNSSKFFAEHLCAADSIRRSHDFMEITKSANWI